MMVILFAVIVVLFLCFSKIKADPKQFFEVNKSSDRSELLNRGTQFIHKDMPDSALAYFAMAANGYKQAKLSVEERKTVANALSNSGYVYLFSYNDYLSAFTSFLASNEITSSEHFTRTECINYLNIGNLYSSNNDFEEAAKYYKLAFDLARENEYYGLLSLTVIDIADLYFNSQDNISAVKELIRGFPLRSLPGGEPVTPFVTYFYNGLKSIDENNALAIEWHGRAKDTKVDVHKAERYKILPQ